MYKCCECEKPLDVAIDSDCIALNKKLLGRTDRMKKLLCKPCLAKRWDMEEAYLDELIKRYKDEGCELFK